MRLVISMIAASILIPSASASAQDQGGPYQQWDQVEVLDQVNDVWDPCVVLASYPGAYKLSCNNQQSIRRDIHVRKVGEAQVEQTAANVVSGQPFKRFDVVLGSPVGLPSDWQLCVIIRNEVKLNNSYVLNCGYDDIRVTPQWVRKDPGSPN